jgi:hypothetical protein
MPKELHIPIRRTLIKDRVGCVRTSVYDLPENNFSYGKPNIQGAEGAGDIISNWVTSDPSAGKESNKLIVFSNILAISKGCVTAKAIRRYAMEHPNIRRKETLSASDATKQGNDHRFEGPFGRKTVYAEEKFGDILGAKFTNFSTEDADYPDVSTVTKKGKLPKPRTTNASDGVIKARMAAKEKQERPHFVMKRFQKVKGTFHLPDVKIEHHAPVDFIHHEHVHNPTHHDVPESA